MRNTLKLSLIFGVCVMVCLFGYTAMAQRPSVEVAEQAAPTLSGFGVSPGNVLFNAEITLTVQATDVSGVATVQANIDAPNGSRVATITLYDDGSHQDGAAGNNIYGNTWTVPNNSPTGRYSVKIEANDQLGNVTSPIVENSSFNVGGIGVVITSPLDGASLATASVPVQITAGDPNGLSRIELYNESTLIGQVSASGQRSTVTINWDTHAVRGQKTIQAYSYGGSGTRSSSLVNLTVNSCIAGQEPFDETVCSSMCTSGGVAACQHPQQGGVHCDSGYTYEGFDCRWDRGCCYQGAEIPGDDNVDVSAVPISVYDPTSGLSINTQTYTVSANAVITDPDIAAQLKVRFYLDGVQVDDQFYANDSDPATNLYRYHSIYTLTNGSHSIRARLYDSTRYDPADSTTYHDSTNVNVTVAITLPIVVIESPGANSFISGIEPVLVTADYTSNITRIALYDASSTYIGEYIPNPATPHILRELIEWDTTKTFDGTHNLYAVAYSGSQVGYSATIPVVVDNNNPTIEFAKSFLEIMAKDNRVGGGVNADYPNKTDGTVIIEVVVADGGSGVSRVEYYLNGALQTTVTTSPYEWEWNSDAMKNDNYKLTARVYDRTGKYTETDAQEITLDHCAFINGICEYSKNECCLAGDNVCSPIGECK